MHATKLSAHVNIHMYSGLKQFVCMKTTVSMLAYKSIYACYQQYVCMPTKLCMQTNNRMYAGLKQYLCMPTTVCMYETFLCMCVYNIMYKCQQRWTFIAYNSMQHRNLGQHSLFHCHSTSHGSHGT